jgi:hypothetical protein
MAHFQKHWSTDLQEAKACVQKAVYYLFLLFHFTRLMEISLRHGTMRLTNQCQSQQERHRNIVDSRLSFANLVVMKNMTLTHLSCHHLLKILRNCGNKSTMPTWTPYMMCLRECPPFSGRGYMCLAFVTKTFQWLMLPSVQLQ